MKNKLKTFAEIAKTEVFFLKQTVRYHYGPIFYFRYLINKFLGLKFLKTAEAIKYEPQDDFEIHTLSQKAGLWRLYWGLRSFIHYSGLKPQRIVVHDDGSIDDKTAKILESKFPNLKILFRREADNIINKLDIPEKIKHYRYGRNVLILGFTDTFLLSQADKVMFMDNDILFFKKPQEVVDFVKDDSVLDSLAVVDKGHEILDVDEFYNTKYNLRERGAFKVNSGLIFYKRKKFTLDMFSEYFDHTLDSEGHFIEQTGWGCMIVQVNHKFLDPSIYSIKGKVNNSTVMKHYTNPRRHEIYGMGIYQLKQRLK